MSTDIPGIFLLASVEKCFIMKEKHNSSVHIGQGSFFIKAKKFIDKNKSKLLSIVI